MKSLGKEIILKNIQMNKNRSKKMQGEFWNSLKKLKIATENFDSEFDYVFNNKQVRETYLTVNLFPEKFNQRGINREADFTNDIKAELRWQCKIFHKYEDIINHFVQLKDKIDEFILEEKYEEAKMCLENVESKYGVSYWLLENKLLIYRKLNLEMKRDIVNEDPFTSIVLYYYDMKSSDEIKSRDFRFIVNKDLSTFKKNFPKHGETADCYTYFIAPFLFEMSEVSIAHLLAFLYRFPLIDRYIAILDILKFYVSKVSEKIPAWLNSVLDYISGVNDSNVRTYRFITASEEERMRNFQIEDDLMGIKNRYILGDLEQCYEITRDKIENGSSDIKLFNMYVELSQLLGYDESNIAICETKKKVITSLKNIYCFTDQYRDSLDDIWKICDMSFQAKWAKDICFEVLKNIKPMNSKIQIDALKYSNLQKITIETVLDNLSKDDAVDFLKSIQIKEGADYVRYCLLLLEGKYLEASEICRVSQLSDMLQVQEERNFATLEAYLKTDKPRLYKIQFSKLLWDIMCSDEEYDKAIDYFINLFFENEEFVNIAPMEKFMKYASETKRKYLRIPILYYIYTEYIDENKKDDLTIAFDDFFYYNNIEKASNIDYSQETYDKKQLVFFLRYVCSPKIMGPVLLTIKTSNELENERIAICQILREIDSTNIREYDQEIEGITHKLFLNNTVSTFETHKIQVNTDAIKGKISKQLKAMYNKYKYAIDNEISKVIASIYSLKLSGINYLALKDDGDILKEMVITIRNEFVLDAEYGLDSYLSLNIRHGTLAGQLRAPLANKNLLAEKVINSGEYKVDSKWVNRLRERRDKRKVEKAIIKFTKKTDDIIEHMKKELIQISTEEKKTNGLFDYSLSQQEIIITFQPYLWKSGKNVEIEDFIDAVFKRLWEMTELNLENMRGEIKGTIKNKYMEAFAELQQVYKKLNGDFTEADQWIREAQNDMDAALEKISNWFQRNLGGQDSDFQLSGAYQIGLQAIKNIHPSLEFDVNYKQNLAKEIASELSNGFVPIFGILFDNISKYAKKNTDGKYKVDCELITNESGIYVKMLNELDERNDIGETEKKIQNALAMIENNSYLNIAKQEGGSGIPKIYKVLSCDLGLKPKVMCKINDDRTKFEIEISGEFK